MGNHPPKYPTKVKKIIDFGLINLYYAISLIWKNLLAKIKNIL